MSDLRPAVKLYITLLTLCAVGAAAFSLSAASEVPERWPLAGAMLALTVLTCAFPLHIAAKTKITLDMSVIFATALLFEPGVAMLIVGLGTLVAQVARRDPAEQVVFNTAQIVLQAGAAGLLLAVGGWSYTNPEFGTPGVIATIAGAAGAIYLVNLVAVSLIVSLDAREPFWGIVRESLGFGMLQELGLFALGLFAV